MSVDEPKDMDKWIESDNTFQQPLFNVKPEKNSCQFHPRRSSAGCEHPTTIRCNLRG